MTKKGLKEYTFITLIFIFIMEYELLLVRTFFLDRIIKISALIPLLLYSTYKIDIELKKIVLLWFCFFSIIFLTNLFRINEVVIIQFLKMIFMFSAFIIIIYKVRPSRFTDKIIKFPVLIGALMALHSLILALLVLSGIQFDYELIDNERISAVGRAYNMFWGSMLYTIDGGYFGWVRAIGHFLTPSKLATFLEYSFFVGFGYYIITRKIRFLISSLLSGLCIFITFSYAGYSAVIASSIIGYMFSLIGRIRSLRRAPVKTSLITMTMAALMLYGFMGLVKYQRAQANTPFTEMFFRGGEEKATFNVINDQERGLLFFIERIKEYPFGKSLDMGEGERPQFAPFYWLEIAGLPGLLFIFSILGYVYVKYVVPALMSKRTTIQPYLGLCFISQTINQIGEGTWLITPYLFTMAMLVLLNKYEFKTTYSIQ